MGATWNVFALWRRGLHHFGSTWDPGVLLLGDTPLSDQQGPIILGSNGAFAALGPRPPPLCEYCSLHHFGHTGACARLEYRTIPPIQNNVQCLLGRVSRISVTKVSPSLSSLFSSLDSLINTRSIYPTAKGPLHIAN